MTAIQSGAESSAIKHEQGICDDIQEGVIVRNPGNVTARGPLTVTLSASVDDASTADDIVVGTITKQVVLKPGSGKFLLVPFQRSILAPGTYRIIQRISFAAPINSSGLPAPTKPVVDQAASETQTIQQQIDDALSAGQSTPEVLETVRQVLATRPDGRPAVPVGRFRC